jgi:hypothetical protein
MEFLRDRIIEIGRCSGFDLAWNLKRGVGPHSIDALAYDVDGRGGRGRIAVMDLASGYDEFRAPLDLHWIEVAGPPGYDPYNRPFTCGT